MVQINIPSLFKAPCGCSFSQKTDECPEHGPYRKPVPEDRSQDYRRELESVASTLRFVLQNSNDKVVVDKELRAALTRIVRLF